MKFVRILGVCINVSVNLAIMACLETAGKPIIYKFSEKPPDFISRKRTNSCE